MNNNIQLSRRVTPNHTIWKYLPIIRALDLIMKRRIRFTKTILMDDDNEGFSSIQQITEASNLNSDANRLIDQFHSIRSYVESNARIFRFALFQIDLDDQSTNTSYELFDEICQHLNLDLKESLSVNYRQECLRTDDLDYFLDQIDSIISSHHEVNFTHTRLSQYIKFIKNNTFLSCWNESSNINMPLWDVYAKNSCDIAIKTSCLKLINAIDATLRRSNELQDCKIYFDKVRYQNGANYLYSDSDDDTADSKPIISFDNPILKDPYSFAKRSLSFKKEAYKGEGEFRVMAINEGANIDDSNIYADFDPQLIDEIHLNPNLKRPREYSELITNLCSKYLNREIPIFQRDKQISG